MSPHKVKLIFNPRADMGNAWRLAADLRPIVEEFGGADWAGTVYPTHATTLARQAAEEGYDIVVAVGGDGTVHEIINGLMQVPKGKRPRLGVVPMGSGNDFAHNVGVTINPPVALRQALSGKSLRVDIGVLEDERGRREYWDNTLGIGFDATVTIRSHRLPIVRGFMMYLIAVIQTIMLNHDAPHFRFVTDEESWEGEKLMIVLCNGPREGGGFLVAPEAVPDDGVFHYASIDRVSRPMMFRLVPEVMKGTHGRFDCVHMGKFNKLELQADRPLYIHMDGEIFSGFGTVVRQVKVELIPQALEVMI
ncbi:MAG: diacylglycerol kinase family protein [Chloroflexota bacterium]